LSKVLLIQSYLFQASSFWDFVFHRPIPHSLVIVGAYGLCEELNNSQREHDLAFSEGYDDNSGDSLYWFVNDNGIIMLPKWEYCASRIEFQEWLGTALYGSRLLPQAEKFHRSFTAFLSFLPFARSTEGHNFLLLI
jgi:hypothetical protein